MWFIEIKNVPDKVFENTRNSAPPVEREFLRQRSTYLAAVGEREALMFVLGIIPPTLLSNTAYFWMCFIEGTEYNLRQLREVKEVFPAITRMFPYKMRAEVCNEQSERFVKFLGGKFVRTLQDRSIYEWSN